MPAEGEGQRLAQRQLQPARSSAGLPFEQWRPLSLTLSPCAQNALGGEGNVASIRCGNLGRLHSARFYRKNAATILPDPTPWRRCSTSFRRSGSS